MAMKVQSGKLVNRTGGLNDQQKAMLADYIRRTNVDLGPLFTQVGESDPAVYRALDMIAKGRAVLLQKSH